MEGKRGKFEGIAPWLLGPGIDAPATGIRNPKLAAETPDKFRSCLTSLFVLFCRSSVTFLTTMMK